MTSRIAVNPESIDYIPALEENFALNKAQFGQNPQCGYCFFHSNKNRLFQSKISSGIDLCYACYRSERFRDNDLRCDKRLSLRNRRTYLWTLDQASKVEAASQEDVNQYKLKNPEKSTKKRKCSRKSARKRKNENVEVKTKAKKRQKEVLVTPQKVMKNLKNIRAQMNVNETTRAHLRDEYENRLKVEEAKMMSQLKHMKRHQ